MGGTAVLLTQQGWKISFVALTGGECGSQALDATTIAQKRHVEAGIAAQILDAEYQTLHIHDGCISVDLATVQKLIEVIRGIRPHLIFTHPPEDYMLDHTHTAQLVRWAVTEARHPNFPLPRHIPALSERPCVYHVDPEKLLGADGQIVPATTIVDISSVMRQKLTALSAHESQHKPSTATSIGSLDQIERCAIIRGHQIGVQYGEGFRQLLFDSYPRRNLLREHLADKVFTL